MHFEKPPMELVRVFQDRSGDRVAANGAVDSIIKVVKDGEVCLIDILYLVLIEWTRYLRGGRGNERDNNKPWLSRHPPRWFLHSLQ